MTTNNEAETSPSTGDVALFAVGGSSGNAPESSDDVVTAEWEETTTAFQRIRTALKNSSVPRTTDEIADATGTTEATVRRHVDPLVEAGVVAERTNEDATRYAWNPP